MIKKIVATAALILLIAIGAWALAGWNAPKTGDGLSVTASYYPLYDFAKQVGGDKVKVTNITPAGAEPHDFEPAAKDIAAAQKAAVFVYNGGNFEPWTEKFTQDYKGVTVKASDHIAMEEGHEHAEGQEAAEAAEHHEHSEVADPHFWLDPVLAQRIVANIRDGLSKADPANAEYYTANAQRYSQQLEQLDRDFRTGLAVCRQRTIVTSHQSVGYLASRYDLQVEAIAGLSPDSEPSAARLAELSRVVRDKQLKYVFFESLVSRRLADTIATEAGVQTLVLDPLEGLTDEAQKAGKNYLSVQRENLASLRRALACH